MITTTEHRIFLTITNKTDEDISDVTIIAPSEQGRLIENNFGIPKGISIKSNNQQQTFEGILRQSFGRPIAIRNVSIKAFYIISPFDENKKNPDILLQQVNEKLKIVMTDARGCKENIKIDESEDINIEYGEPVKLLKCLFIFDSETSIKIDKIYAKTSLQIKLFDVGDELIDKSKLLSDFKSKNVR